MTQFKLTGFRLNDLQWIAEKASQKKVLYLQPEVKRIRDEINIQDFVLREQGQREGWDCSYHGQDYHQRYAVPVFIQAQHSAGYVGREGPLELVRFALQRTVPRDAARKHCRLTVTSTISRRRLPLPSSCYQRDARTAIPTVIWSITVLATRARQSQTRTILGETSRWLNYLSRSMG